MKSHHGRLTSIVCLLFTSTEDELYQKDPGLDLQVDTMPHRTEPHDLQQQLCHQLHSLLALTNRKHLLLKRTEAPHTIQAHSIQLVACMICGRGPIS